MKIIRVYLLAVPLAVLVAIVPAAAQQRDDASVPGYRHSAANSRFLTSESVARQRPVVENGFVKYQDRMGVFAIDPRSGLAMAVPSDSRDKSSNVAGAAGEEVSMRDPDKHNRMAVSYFVGGGLPRAQVGQVHANTYLSASGPADMPVAQMQPRVDGYASIVTRKVDRFAVADSVAWVRFAENGRAISEWVYWPELPAKVVEDARRLNELVAGKGRADYIAKLPSTQKEGRVVIRHSSPFAAGQFEAYATYDVVERNTSKDRQGEGAAYVRHFTIDGREIRLPQERRDLGADYPAKTNAEQPAR